MWPFKKSIRSAKEIYAVIVDDHHAYLKRHGLTGPSPNNMGTPENPYGSLALSKEYQDYIARQRRKWLAEGRTPPEPPSDDPKQWW